LPVKAQLCLAERDRNGLLSVVADCLDRLLVAPNIPGLLEDMGLNSAPKRPVRRRETEGGSQKSKVKSQKSEVKSQKSEVRSQKRSHK
jgi:hypothetical protein